MVLSDPQILVILWTQGAERNHLPQTMENYAQTIGGSDRQNVLLKSIIDLGLAASLSVCYAQCQSSR